MLPNSRLINRLLLDDRQLRITDTGKPFIRNVAAFFDAYLRTAAKEGPDYSRAI